VYQLAPLRVSSEKECNQEHDQTRTNLDTIVDGNTNGVVEPTVDVRYLDIGLRAIRREHGDVLGERVEAS